MTVPNRIRHWGTWVVLVGSALFFAFSVARLAHMPARFTNVEMETSLPLFVQVGLSGGDRYLAANVDVLRALTVSDVNPPPDTLRVQAKIQSDGAWLNPAHEDNYYVAAAMLSWANEVEAANSVLARAVDARPFDFVPPFFLGFNHYYFLHDPLTASRYINVAAARATSEQNRQVFEKTAARWTEQGSRPEEALRVLQGMQKSTRSAGVRQYLEERIIALRQLIELRAAGDRYRSRFSHSPKNISDLIQAGLIRKLPPNPPGRAFVLDEAGVPQLINLTPLPRIKQ